MTNNSYKVTVTVEDGGEHKSRLIETGGLLVVYKTGDGHHMGSDETLGLGVSIFGEFNPVELLGLCKAIEFSVLPKLVLEAHDQLVAMGMSSEEADKAIAEVLLEQGGLNNIVEEAADGNT